MKQLVICYFRVSTRRQGRSGIGIKAQKIPVYQYIKDKKLTIFKEFSEVGSGMDNKRPKMLKALELCKKYNAQLIVSSQDRLSRSAGFIISLKEEGQVKFTAVDNPEANDFMKIILAVIAQHTWETIQSNAMKTVQVHKRQNKKLGTNGRKLSLYYKRRQKLEDKKLCPKIRRLRKSGFRTVRAITNELNRLGVRSLRGRKLHASSIHVVMKRNRIT